MIDNGNHQLCLGLALTLSFALTPTPTQAAAADKPLLLLSLPTLREYLLHALRPEAMRQPPNTEAMRHSEGLRAEATSRATAAGATVEDSNADEEMAESSAIDAWWDAERVLDDFVFLTFLVGNDFLPALPTLTIANGGLDDCLDTYTCTHARTRTRHTRTIPEPYPSPLPRLSPPPPPRYCRLPPCRYTRCRRSLGGYLLDEGRIQPVPFARYLSQLIRVEESSHAVATTVMTALNPICHPHSRSHQRSLSHSDPNLPQERALASRAVLSTSSAAPPLNEGDSSAGTRGGADGAGSAAVGGTGASFEADLNVEGRTSSTIEYLSRRVGSASSSAPAAKSLPPASLAGSMDVTAIRASEYCAKFGSGFGREERCDLCANYLQALAW